MVLLRRLLGDVLRRHRIRQSRTLRDVSTAAGVSLGYLSEVERGRKEASSELLSAICGALDVTMSEVLREVSDDLAREERRQRLAPVGFGATVAASALSSRVPVRSVAGIPAHHPARPAQPAVPARIDTAVPTALSGAHVVVAA